MRVKVLKSFPFAESRQKTRQAEVDEVLDIADEDVVGGLIDGDFVEPATDEPEEPVEIPEAWAKLDKTARLALATAIKGKAVRSEKVAAEVITNELANRAASSNGQ